MGSWLDAIGGPPHVTLAAAADWFGAGKLNSHSPKRFGSLSCCAGRQGAGGRFTSWHVTPATDIAPDSNILPPFDTQLCHSVQHNYTNSLLSLLP